MAALMAGVQYGLSSHSNFYANKDVIFVKLTDSAQRAIEDYARNLNFSDEKPTIQFLGNEGKLNFPTSHGTAGFTFSLSNNHDMEGPQGAFECVQQTGPKSLESLGTLPCKMRIHANDDVYEKTRHRMAAVEENNKNKCTRVIKANGPDIGRKVKVKAPVRTVAPPVKAKTSESSIPRAMMQSSRLNYSTTSMPPSSSSSSMPLSSTMSAQKSAMTSNNPPARTQPNKKISDLMRRPLKERLIHVLALRPYKKPELFDRIQKEGMKEREKSMMTTILKQIAQMRDNTYQLHRHVWNEVQEDWPFYTEQERAMLKRKKPQNLTPPGTSSDGSGHSPNSVHPGSPPGIVAPAPGYMSSKRPGYYEGSDGIQTKRPRISHYRKPEANSRTGLSSGQMTNSGNHGNPSAMNSAPQVIVHDSNSNWDNQRQNQRDYRSERTANSDVLRSSYNSISKSCKTPTSDCEIDNSATNSNSTQSSSSQLSVFNIAKHNSHSSLSRHHSNGDKTSSSSANDRISGSGVSSAASSVCAASPVVESLARRPREVETASSARQRADRERERERIRETREIKHNNLHGASNSYDNEMNSSNNTADYHHVNGNSGVTDRSVSQVSPETSDRRHDYEDLETLYPPITCLAQRRQYTALFTADYEEYRKLYVELEGFSNLFNRLKARYVEAESQGLTETCKEIRREIELAFFAVKADPAKYSAKKRFDYLHVKLSHLQKQVEAYDRIYPYADDNDNNIMNGYGLEY